MVRIAKISFQNSSKLYDYFCVDEDINEGDEVFVQSYVCSVLVSEIKYVDEKNTLATKKVLCKAQITPNEKKLKRKKILENEIELTKEILYSIENDNLMMYTVPGRMGDEDGCYLIANQKNEYICYRTDGIIYGTNKYSISYDDILKYFPDVENLSDGPNFNILYMGFGNLLCVNKKIYDTFIDYLKIAARSDDDFDHHLPICKQSHVIWKTWREAYNLMIDNMPKK